MVDEPGRDGEFTPLAAEAAFAHVLHSGRAITAPRAGGSVLSEEDGDYLGLPGLLSPEQTAALLASRDCELRRRTSGMSDSIDQTDAGQASSWQEATILRKDINSLVAQVAARTGRGHAEIHGDVRRAVPGPRTASASMAVLLARRDHLLGLVSAD